MEQNPNDTEAACYTIGTPVLDPWDDVDFDPSPVKLPERQEDKKANSKIAVTLFNQSPIGNTKPKVTTPNVRKGIVGRIRARMEGKNSYPAGEQSAARQDIKSDIDKTINLLKNTISSSQKKASPKGSPRRASSPSYNKSGKGAQNQTRAISPENKNIKTGLQQPVVRNLSPDRGARVGSPTQNRTVRTGASTPNRGAASPTRDRTGASTPNRGAASPTRDRTARTPGTATPDRGARTPGTATPDRTAGKPGSPPPDRIARQTSSPTLGRNVTPTASPKPERNVRPTFSPTPERNVRTTAASPTLVRTAVQKSELQPRRNPSALKNPAPATRTNSKYSHIQSRVDTGNKTHMKSASVEAFSMKQPESQSLMPSAGTSSEQSFEKLPQKSFDSGPACSFDHVSVPDPHRTEFQSFDQRSVQAKPQQRIVGRSMNFSQSVMKPVLQAPSLKDRYNQLDEDYKLLEIKAGHIDEQNVRLIKRLQAEIEFYKDMLIKQKEQFDIEKELWERNATADCLIDNLKKELEIRCKVESRNQCEISRLKKGIRSQ